MERRTRLSEALGPQLLREVTWIAFQVRIGMCPEWEGRTDTGTASGAVACELRDEARPCEAETAPRQ